MHPKKSRMALKLENHPSIDSQWYDKKETKWWDKENGTMRKSKKIPARKTHLVTYYKVDEKIE